MTPEEQEELRKKEERKDRLHQNYLRRKANGKQKKYEDMAKGVFYIAGSVPTAGAADL